MILLIDDQQEMLEVLGEYLTDSGDHHTLDGNIVKLSSGKGAIELIQNNQVEVVVTDLLMPSLNGVELIKAIRSFSQVPIVVISQMMDVLENELIKFDGIYSLPKPFTKLEFLQMVGPFLK